MKKIKSFYLVIALAFAVLISCGEEEKIVYTTTVTATEPDISMVAFDPPIADATVTLYNSEIDYLGDINPVAQGITNEKGEFKVQDDTEKSYWVRVTKGNLSNLRFKANNTKYGSSTYATKGGSSPTLINSFRLQASLSTTPTKLQLKVLTNGGPVSGANVQLYLTEQDYQNGIPAQTKEGELIQVYGKDSYGYSSVFTGKTNAEGILLLNNLEARNYWFKITKDGKSNSGTIFTTLSPLPDNGEVTTNLEVGIQ